LEKHLVPDLQIYDFTHMHGSMHSGLEGETELFFGLMHSSIIECQGEEAFQS